MQGLFDTLHEEVALIDGAGVLIAVNAAWRDSLRELGSTAADGGVGLRYLDLCHEISRDLDAAAFRAGVSEVIARGELGYTYAFTGRMGRGHQRRRVRITPLATDLANLLIVIHEDVEAHPSGLSVDDVFSARDEERQRIGIELHDSTSQHLVALGMGVARLRRMLGEAADDILADMSTSVTEIVKEIRVLSFLKRPPTPTINLSESTLSFVSGFGRRTGIRAHVSIHGKVDDAPAAVNHAVFRILQESLSNVYRHARATEVDVELRGRLRSLTMSVVDNGCGIAGLDASERPQPDWGVGILGMQTRARQLGGHLEIASHGTGVILTATLPYKSPASGKRTRRARPAGGSSGIPRRRGP